MKIHESHSRQVVHVTFTVASNRISKTFQPSYAGAGSAADYFS